MSGHPRTARSRRRPQGEDGLSLVELMVVVALAGIVLAAVANTLIQTQRTVSMTLQRQSDLGQVRAVDAVSADLRTLTELGSTYLLTATAREVEFFAFRDVPRGATPSPAPTLADEGPSRIRIRREDNGDLARTVVRPRPGAGANPVLADYTGQPEQRRILARGLRPDVALFGFRTAEAVSSALPLVDPGTGVPAVPEGQRQHVRFIEIRVAVQGRPAGARSVGPTEVRQLVRLPNLPR